MTWTQTAREQRAGHDGMLAKAHSRRRLLRLGGGGAVAGALLAGGMRAPRVAADPPAIVGSWYLIRSTTEYREPARLTWSFMADGTLVGQAIGGGPNPSGNTLSASVGNGVWAQTGDGAFGFTYLHVRYEVQTGLPYSLFKVFGDITLDPGGNTFAVTYHSNPLNLDSLMQEENRTLLQGTGMRIVLEPNRQ